MDNNLLNELRRLTPAQEVTLQPSVVDTSAAEVLEKLKQEYLEANRQTIIEELERLAIEAANSRLSTAKVTRTVDPEESEILKHTMLSVRDYFAGAGFSARATYSNDSNYHEVIEKGYEPHPITEHTRGVEISW